MFTILVSTITIRVTREALRTCKNTLVIITDHAPWNGEPFDWLEIESFQITFGIRNYIERWYHTFKERTKRFYNNFPIRNEERAIECDLTRRSNALHLRLSRWYHEDLPEN